MRRRLLDVARARLAPDPSTCRFASKLRPYEVVWQVQPYGMTVESSPPQTVPSLMHRHRPRRTAITFVSLAAHHAKDHTALASLIGRRERSLGGLPIGCCGRASGESCPSASTCSLRDQAGRPDTGCIGRCAVGHDCVVVAPALIQSSPRPHQDRSPPPPQADAAGSRRELTEIWVPYPQDESMRDLVRARAAARGGDTVASAAAGLLLRNGIVYEGRTRWTRRHRSWLAGCASSTRASDRACRYRTAHVEAETRRDRLTHEIERLMASWKRAPLVAALQAMRGVALVTAATLVAEIDDFRRFGHPRQLMAYLGQVPSENSSGERVRCGGITKAVNAEFAGCSPRPPDLSRQAAPTTPPSARREGLPYASSIADKARRGLPRDPSTCSLRASHGSRHRRRLRDDRLLWPSPRHRNPERREPSGRPAQDEEGLA